MRGARDSRAAGVKRASRLAVAVLLLAVWVSAKAIFPLAILPGLSLVFESGTLAASYAAAVGLIGSALYFLKFKAPDGSDALTVKVNPAAPEKVPAGWTPNADPSQAPNPPASTGAVTGYYMNGTGQTVQSGFTSASAACQAWASSIGYPLIEVQAPSYCVAGGVGCCWYSNNGGQSYAGNITIYSGQTCPNGYTASGGGCSLSSASAVRYPADNDCGLHFSGGVMSYDSRDPDCDSPQASSGATLSSDGTTLTVRDATGTNQTQVAVQADGSLAISQWTNNGDGTTAVSQATVSPQASDTVLLGGTSGTVNAVGPSALGVSPGASVSASGAGSSPFPSDYARDATVAALGAKVDQLHTDLTSPGTPAQTPAAKTQDEIAGVLPTSQFSGLLSWTLPARSVSCPTWTFTVWGQNYVMDSQCTLAANVQGTVSAVMLLVWALVALFIVLSA